MVHDLYLVQVESPEDQAFRPLNRSKCNLVNSHISHCNAPTTLTQVNMSERQFGNHNHGIQGIEAVMPEQGRQADRAAAGDVQGRRSRASEGLARGSRQAARRGFESRSRKARGCRGRPQTDEVGRIRGRRPAPENPAGGKRVVVRAERGTGGVTQGLRSGQSDCVGCIEGSALPKS
jgi:hypothetical protein